MISSSIFRLLFILTILSTPCLIPTSYSLERNELWLELAKGGHVVLIRHAPVVKTKNPLVRDPSCQEERNLSVRGKTDARKVGQQFIKYNIPISEVFHSPYCRTADTAKNAFNRGVAKEYLSLLEVLTPVESTRQTSRLNNVIGSYAGKGNLLMVTHAPNINAISFDVVKHLDIIVFRPKGGDEFEELGMIKFTEAD